MQRVVPGDRVRILETEKEALMCVCGDCGGATHILDSRKVSSTGAVRRRRKCLVCESRHSTYEIPVRSDRDKELISWVLEAVKDETD